MNFLAIETSSDNAALCITHKGRVILDLNRRARFGASRMLGYIEKALKELPFSLADVDAFVVGAGPGSFTGLRISYSIVKAFVLSTNKPAIAVGSFFSCAYPLRKLSKTITVVGDARRNLIYHARFASANGSLKAQKKEQLLNSQDITSYKDPLFVTYDSGLRDLLCSGNAKLHFYAKDIYPKARYLLPRAEELFRRGEFTPLDKLEPLYLHPKTCQVRKKTRK